MIQITEMRQTGPERFVLTFSAGETLAVTLETVADFSLYSGRELEAEELETLREAAGVSRAKDRALRIIGARPLSQRALYDRLVEKGETEAHAAAAVARLSELGLLDDAAYAAMVARHCAAGGYGPRRAREELYRRKVPRELWDAALEQLPEQDDTVDRLLRQRLKQPDPDQKALKRATDALLRRGFGWDAVRAALERWRAEMEEAGN